MVVLTYAEAMLCFPFSRWDSTRFRIRSTLSAISSALMSTVPTGAWKVFLSFVLMVTDLRRLSIIAEGSAPGAMGFGIFPRGPRTVPSLLPTTAIRGASAMK